MLIAWAAADYHSSNYQWMA